jgi:hypothetical protein
MLKYYERYLARLQILLIPDILVCGDDHIETGLLGNVDQLPVYEFFPSAGPRFLHEMARKKSSKTSGCAVIEKNQHPGRIYP